MEWLLCCWHALVEGDDSKKWGRRNGQVVPHHSQMRDFKWGSTPLFCIFWRSLFQVQMGQTETQLGPKCRYPNYVHGNPEQVCYLLHVYLIVGMSSELTNIKSLWRNNKNWTEEIYIYISGENISYIVPTQMDAHWRLEKMSVSYPVLWQYSISSVQQSWQDMQFWPIQQKVEVERA